MGDIVKILRALLVLALLHLLFPLFGLTEGSIFLIIFWLFVLAKVLHSLYQYHQIFK